MGGPDPAQPAPALDRIIVHRLGERKNAGTDADQRSLLDAELGRDLVGELFCAPSTSSPSQDSANHAGKPPHSFFYSIKKEGTPGDGLRERKKPSARVLFARILNWRATDLRFGP